MPPSFMQIALPHLRALVNDLEAAYSGDVEPAYVESVADLPTTRPVDDQWELVEALANQSYTWPTGTEDYVDGFRVYTDGSLTLGAGFGAVGRAGGAREVRPMVALFRMGSGGGSKRPIVPFVAADDYETTGEMVAVIRGKGDNGKSMFAPGDQLPEVYDGFQLDNYGKRVTRGYDRLCVVAQTDDVQTMLNHAANQVRLRNLYA